MASGPMTYSRGARSGAEGPPVSGAATGLREAAGVGAVLLGGFSLWILVAQLASPQQSYFPSGLDEANAMYADRGSAAKAAQIGLVRGDLWTVAAVTAAAPLLIGATDNSNAQISQDEIESMHATAARAARLSPHDARIWLVLAALDFRTDANNPKGIEALKLAYYTGPDEISLMPTRLLLAVRSGAIFDDEVQSLVPLDIRRILAQRPDLKPAIATAYSNALPKGREIIQAILKEADPKFLATLTAPNPTRQLPF